MFRLLQLTAAACFFLASLNSSRGAEVRIAVGAKLPPASAIALTELREALSAHGDTFVEATTYAAAPLIVVGLVGKSQALDAALRSAKQTLPEARETAAIVDVPTESKTKVVAIAGSDDRGLSYALRDAARAIAVTPKDKAWHEELTFAVEQPFLKVRNVSVHLFNADCEREWFFSEEFWRFYFQRLSLSRFNRCALTYCDQTNYLCPPYAYLVEMPEYPSVKIADCTPEQRAQNVQMLKRISELADEYAIDFDLGIWMQGPVAKWAAPVQVTGLPEGMQLAEYCALGLRRILEACPSIDGIQLRMNAEAGVPEDQQTAFYRPMFQTLAALQAKQRPDAPYRLELRYKGLTDETIKAARDEKLDVTVSTKFWAEHFGLPYHPTVVDSHYAKDRYSFGTLLKKPRDYRVTYQLWTVGSQRLTLWGDPAYCKQFAQSCTLGGGEGFEVFAPLTNKGYGNQPGAWPVIKNPEYRVGKWEQERYWAFYLAFGRMGYNPESSLDFWHREFRHRFGDAGKHIEQAYCEASKVLPLISTLLLPSASEWYWWPEMDTGGDMETYSRIQTGDPGMYSAVRTWKQTPGWRWEEWDERPGFAEELESNQLSGRRTPWDYQLTLRGLASHIDTQLSNARRAQHPTDAEWRITEVDLQVLQNLADYHGNKLYVAAANVMGRSESDSGVAAWRKIAEVTDGVYYDDLVFGITPDMPRSKNGHHHSGHWRDRLAQVEADAAKRDESQIVRQSLSFPQYFHRDSSYYKEHTTAKSFDPTKPLVLTFKTASGAYKGPTVDGPQKMVVHVRPLDQTRPWREFEMKRTGTDEFRVLWQATIPPNALDPHFDMQYYFTMFHTKSGPFTWGPGEFEPPYYVVPVEVK